MTSPEAERAEPAGESARGDFLLNDGECPFRRFYARKSGFETPDGRRYQGVEALEGHRGLSLRTSFGGGAGAFDSPRPSIRPSQARGYSG